MYEDGGFRIADLIMRQGASRAEAAARKFAMIGQGVADLGQNVGGILQARDEQRATSKRAAATAALFSGEGPPDPKRVLAVLGPEHGAKVIDAMGSFQKIQQAQAQQVQLDEKQATEEFGKLAHGFSSLPPEVQAQLYPAVSGLARRSGKFPEMPEEFTPEVASQIGAFGQAWSAGSQKPEGFTLAPGQVRFGPDGQQIAAAPAAPEKPAGPRVVGRSLVDESGKVIYRDPEAPQRADAEPLVAIMGEDGSPVLVPRSQAAGKRPASNREQGRAVTSGDANRLADLDTSLDDIIALESALSGSRATGATARAGAMLPDFVTELTGLG
ncbi:hypothetical protein, partial [Longimicrobium sp.]|uniref:hypothetical protein n=1 Tax=Longimicrobium sp. TaxID=2029185 RepID=UPI002E30E6C0